MKIIVFDILLIFLAALVGCTGNISEPEIIAGLDTTSHNFFWQYDTIGIRQSYLRNVSIISPDDIWAVGEINTEDTGIPDSTGKIIRAYNAVHWNGSEWELHRLKTATPKIGLLDEDPINAVYAFSSNDIWMFSNLGAYLHWDGLEWKTEFLWERKGGIYTIWGFSSDDLYFAGSNGSVTHYDGNSFTLVPTYTTLDIKDIYGSMHPTTGEKEVLCVASTSIPPPGRGVYKSKGNYFIQINSDSLPNLISTLWFISDKVYYVGGDGLFSAKILGQSWIWEEGLLPYYKTNMIGSHENDLFIIGSFGYVAHYNGVNWYNYNDLEIPFFSGTLAGVDFKDNLIIATGASGSNAIILRGYRL